MGEMSFGGEPSFPKPKKHTTFATTATGNDDCEEDPFDRPFDRPASTSKNMTVDCDMDAEEHKSQEIGTQASNYERNIYVENPGILDILEQELNRGKRVQPKPTPTPAKVTPKEPVKQQVKTRGKKEQDVPLEDLPKNKKIKITTPYGVVEEIEMEFDDISKGPTMPLMISSTTSVQTQEETKEVNKKSKDSKKEPKKDEWRQDRRGDRVEEVKNNEQFVNYYKHLRVLPPNEWKAFYDKLKEPLDIAFRINSIE